MSDSKYNPDRSAILTIFGASGDLAWRKLVPALYRLAQGGWLPENFRVLGLGHTEMSDDAFREHLREGVEQSVDDENFSEEGWEAFARTLRYIAGDFLEDTIYTELAEALDAQEKSWSAKGCRMFYLATPPSMIDVIPAKLHRAGLAQSRRRARIVVEKPFGRDLESARALNKELTELFHEHQIYRIDHYLGKETVQNILAFRFANALFEPIWDRRYIDHVQITVAERVGVGSRGSYYEGAGALRDMIQNHLLQIFSLVAMEPPVSFEAEEVRNRKIDLLRAVRRIKPEEVSDVAVRGQYAKGWLQGEAVGGYRAEQDVAEDSSTETYAAMKLFVDNWRWQGVPFYLRTGKRLPQRASDVSVHFAQVPHNSFPANASAGWEPNRIELHIQPEEGIDLRFQAKRPGLKMRLSPVQMRFSYKDAFKDRSPFAYETLLLDVIKGDATLFMRADQVEEAWAIMAPVLSVWGENPAMDFPNYAAGTWGPEAAEALIARDGRSWLSPSGGL
ncbi:glucose-6-phosphate dehydrogenase [Bradymonas sediminis]|uniref:Glucose-6-phosphate 1-dehydrogenase n=1 Tax=Bradymonas sediminis TaxID=1548548 RepID=A0A2Z4FJD0_9DELT|nr:glucose-6-phosphate dehydrogenase [Bradymonas sediminis]AWV88788.1 glucose-6-phosphate dehydrogenase [Bradymonas sediminis]TDP61786.1 glucose-6-phosphate 1-dehydrogenase [Bradymonas sediminis]